MGGIVGGMILIALGVACFMAPDYIRRFGVGNPDCSYLISAAVLGFEERKEQLEDRRSKALFPILDFVYNGKHYKYTSWYGQYPPMCKVGERISLDIDPNNPTTHCFQTYLLSNRSGSGRAMKYILFSVGAGFIAFGAVVLIIAIFAP